MDTPVVAFEKAVRTCLDSVCARDEATHSQFFHDDIPFMAIVPMGVFSDVRSYMNSQRANWYGVKTGAFSYSIFRLECSGDLGFVSLKAIYENIDAEGKFRKEILIGNLFRRWEGHWYLSFNQNTVLATTREL